MGEGFSFFGYHSYHKSLKRPVGTGFVGYPQVTTGYHRLPQTLRVLPTGRLGVVRGFYGRPAQTFAVKFMAFRKVGVHIVHEKCE